MHILDLPANISSELYTSATGVIRPSGIWNGFARPVTGTNADGTLIFGSGYVPLQFNLQERLLNTPPISIETQKPILPLDGKDNVIMASQVTLTFDNSSQNWGVEQVGSMLSPWNIEQSRVTLTADINGQTLPVFRGRVYGRPSEEFGKTTFTVRDEFWHIARKPVVFEKFSGQQNTRTINGNLHSDPFQLGDSNYYDGISVFIQNGFPYTSVKNENEDVILLNGMGIQTGAPLGKYTIKFLDPVTYNITYPDNNIYQGIITGATLGTPYIILGPGHWQILGDATGKTIEFWIYKTVSGNPVDIILNELEKAYTGLYGQLPTRPAILPIDYAAFDIVRAHFSGFTVHVSETNENNDVYLNLPGKKPLNVLQFCQRIADHILCQIIVDNFGHITIKSPGILNETVRQLDDSDAIISHSIQATKPTNYYKFQYGFNPVSRVFTGFIVHDERFDQVQDEKDIKIFNLPYYPLGTGGVFAQEISDMLMDRIQRAFTLITLTVKPNYAISMRAGDRFRVVTTTAPVMDFFVECYDSAVDIGGVGVLKCVKIPYPKVYRARFCIAVFCTDLYCN